MNACAPCTRVYGKAKEEENLDSLRLLTKYVLQELPGGASLARAYGVIAVCGLVARTDAQHRLRETAYNAASVFLSTTLWPDAVCGSRRSGKALAAT